MLLHKNKELFEQTILNASEELKIENGIIEKDYYVTLILKELTKKLPNLIFKGGTSLSKCYKIIKRFSEDIDLNLDYEDKLTQGQRKSAKKYMEEISSEFELDIVNLEETRSRREYNKYKISYPAIFTINALKPYVYVETVFSVKAFPTERKMATNIIYEFLKDNGYDNIISQYQLEPFEICVQSLERTFIDKIFALCDYVLDGRIKEHSRHLYDVHKLFQVINIDENLKRLVGQVRIARCENKFCFSAAKGVNIQELLQRIIAEDIYKTDYNSITKLLLYEDIEYSTCIETLQKIKKSNLFDNL